MLVQLDKISKVYDMGKVEVVALQEVTLSIEAGEFTAVMGPSGSGKSTVMNLIGCLDKPTSGALKINGTDVAGLSDRQLARLRGEQIGFVFQTFNLIPRIDAMANVMLPMSFVNSQYTLPRGERERRGRDLLRQVGLAERVRHLPNELSGGERQRVAIARALANDPKIILADEPTGNLDTKTGKAILDLFVELNKQGRTIILVTHDPNIASYARRVIRLLDGRVVEDGNPRGSA